MGSAKIITIVIDNRFTEDSEMRKKKIRVEVGYYTKFKSILKTYKGDYLTFMNPDVEHMLCSISADDTPESRGLKAGQEYEMTVV